MNLPKEFLEKMQKLLTKEQFDFYLRSFNEDAKRGVVLNTKLKDEKEILSFLPSAEKIAFAKTGYRLVSNEKLGNTWFHHAGLIYMQEPSSMAAASMIEEQDNLKILDLCASPGGKTIDACLKCGENSIIVSNEINRERAKVLYQNVERLGLKNVIVINNSPQELSRVFNEYFDCILVDAPCSGEGMFRKDPATIEEWKPGIDGINSLRQKEIVIEADKMLKKGGKIIYSTCTYSPKENEDIVQFLIDNGYSVIKPNEVLLNCSARGITQKTKYACRFYPQDDVGEGQFVCGLIKQKESKYECKTNQIAENYTKNIAYGSKNYLKTAKYDVNSLKSAEKTAKIFIEQTINAAKIDICVKNNNVFAQIDKNIEDLPLRFIACGINVGEIVKDRLEPHHQFFKVFGKDFKIKIDLNKDDAAKYLAGEELQTDLREKGFAVVCFNGAILGGVKIANGRLKNYYPKALRSKLKI